MLRTFCLAAGLGLAALPVLAQDVPVETAKLGKSGVTLHVHPFLTEEELATLRLVMTNKEDTLVPPRNGEALAKAIPGAKLLSLDAGHAGVIEFPHEHNAAILEFLGAAVLA